MAATQRHLAERALQLLALPAGSPALLLDVGCGTGYSGGPLERAGHAWVGVDLSELMLRAARAERRPSAGPRRRVHDVLCADMGVRSAYR
jgi:Methylase involved in ubiquinone/menaquinone biosynthesis